VDRLKGFRLKSKGAEIFFVLLPSVKMTVSPDVAKVGGLQSQGAKGAADAIYCNPLATTDLESSGFPARV
jgi:hypothetical protein